MGSLIDNIHFGCLNWRSFGAGLLPPGGLSVHCMHLIVYIRLLRGKKSHWWCRDLKNPCIKYNSLHGLKRIVLKPKKYVGNTAAFILNHARIFWFIAKSMWLWLIDSSENTIEVTQNYHHSRAGCFPPLSMTGVWSDDCSF